MEIKRVTVRLPCRKRERKRGDFYEVKMSNFARAILKWKLSTCSVQFYGKENANSSLHLSILNKYIYISKQVQYIAAVYGENHN